MKPLSREDEDDWIEGSGIVVRLLHDDCEGAQHQRFVVDTRNGQTLLVAHNVDISPKVPVSLGDRVRFRGLYEWNDLGGVIHWTHRDPRREETGGFIEFRGKKYS